MAPISSHRRVGLLALGPLLLSAGAACAYPPFSRPDPGLLSERYIHQDFRPEHGLPGSSVLALTQTRDGYLLLGTERGLARFDGVAFTPLELPSLAPPGHGTANAVRALLEDSAGDLWVGTQRGLLHRRGGTIRRYTMADGLPEDFVTALLKDDHGTLWVGTEGGLARRQGERFVPVAGLTQSVLGIATDYRGDLWVVNHEAFKLRDGALVAFLADMTDPAAEARAVQRDAAGRLYIATFNGLLRFDPPALPGQSPPTRRFTLPGKLITQLLADSAGRVWIGTSGSGLFLLSEDGFEHLGAREGMPDDHVWALTADREGGILVGTGGGLALLRPRAMLTHNDSLPPLWSVCGDRRGLWVGTNEGLIRLEDGVQVLYTRTQGLPSDAVFSCLVTEDGTTLFGTRNGPARWQDGRLIPLSPPVPAVGILAIHQDRMHDLWFAATDVLVRLHGSEVTTYTQRDGLPEGPIRVLREDLSGWLLVGGKSLARMEDGVLRGDGTHLGPIMDAAITADEHGCQEIWLTTYGQGLHLLRNGSYFHFDSAVPELSGALQRILDDGRGSFWISTDDGLLRVEQRALRDVADGKRAGLQVRRYDRLDGLLSTDFNASGQSSGWRGADGRLWFPNGGGLLEVDPARLPNNLVPPLVHIEQVSADGIGQIGQIGKIGQQAAEPLVLPAGTSSLEIRYTAPSLRMPRRMRFRYRLEGTDRDWIEAGTRRVAAYAGLRSGPYRFVVQAQNADGVWSTLPAAIRLHLPPPLTRRPWFVLLCAVGAAGLLWLSGKLLALRHRARALYLEHVVAQRSAELQREIGSRQRAEEALQARKLEAIGRLAGGVSHDLNNVLTAIVNYAEFALEAATEPGLRRDIQEIREAADRAALLTGRLLVFARRQAVTPQGFDLNALIDRTARLRQLLLGDAITVELSLDPDLWPVWADPEQIEQVLLNLCLNARDAMPRGGVLRIETRAVTVLAMDAGRPLVPGDYVLCTVTDQGSGMSAEVRQHLFEPFFSTKGPGLGTGLALCYGIIGQAGGHIEVNSEPGRGTAVSVYLLAAPPDSG